MSSSRFYVGNLSPEISEDDLKSLFARFGTVSKIELKNKRDIDGNITATFSFITLDELQDGDSANIIKQCNHLKWKKQIIRVQLAQESFMQRLQKEREESSRTGSNQNQVSKTSPIKTDRNYDPLALVKKRAEENITSYKSDAISRRKYYSSSSGEEDNEEIPPKKKGGLETSEKFITKLEGFNSDFWNDCEARPHTSNQASKVYQNDTRGNYDSNARRLASLKERQNQIHSQKQTINKELGSKIDIASKSGKVLKLDSGDESNEDSRTKSEAKRGLFDNNEDSSEDEDRFRVRPQFEGKGGEKLLSLQSKFANDSRFKIDERFSEGSKTKKIEEASQDDDMDIAEERERNLKILGSILGKPDMAEVKKPTGKLFKDPSKLRYDPSKKEDQAFIVKEKEEMSSDEDEPSPKVNGSQKESDRPKTSTTNEAALDQKYWVSNSLSQALAGVKNQQAKTEGSNFSFGFQSKQPSSGGFSLLSKFGKADDVNNQQNDFKHKQTKKLSFLENNPFRYESSDTEDEDSGNKNKMNLLPVDPLDLFAQKLKEKALLNKGFNETFFFRKGDARFVEGTRFFTLSGTVEELRAKLDEDRPMLAQIMKKKLRKRAKKQEKMAFDLKKVNRRGLIQKKKFSVGRFNKR